MRKELLLLAVMLLVALPVLGQNINVDMSERAGTPDPSFAGAGYAGVWNVSNGGCAWDEPVSLVDIDNSAILATISYPESWACTYDADYSSPGPATGNDEALLEDGFALGDIPEQVVFENLINGPYRVICYGIYTFDSSNVTGFSINGNSQGCGGEYSGAYEEGITHVIFDVVVDDGSLVIQWNAGTPWGSGFVSGVQLENTDIVATDKKTWGGLKAIYQ